MSTIPTLFAAHKLGYETTQIYTNGQIITHNSSQNRYYSIGSGKQSEIVVSFASSGDSHFAQKTQKDKWTTNTVIERLGLPIAKWQKFESLDELRSIFDNYKKPVVIKPTGLVGGHGVSTGITTLEQAYKAVEIAQAAIEKRDGDTWQRQMMIQEQVSGEDYRILVIDGKFRIATKRIPAFVTGDGKSTIEQLINETNKDPRRDTSNPTHTLKPIIIDEILIDMLTEQGKTLATIPATDEYVKVRKPASMSLGGITEDFTDKLHPQIKFICESLAASIHAYTLGVDIICEDISKPLTSENGSIIEMNTMPEGYLNTYPVIGKQYTEMNEIFVKGLLEKLPTVKQVVIAPNTKNQESKNSRFQSISDIINLVQKELLLQNLDELRIGIYQNGSIYINDTLINSGLSTEAAREALKLNATLDIIAFVYPEIKEVEEFGYGFDRIDLMI
jgi:cyanophycin synthetase